MLIRPLKAIRYKCLDCCCWNSAEVTRCPQKNCILWELRFGKKPKGRKYEQKSVKEYQQLVRSTN